MERTDDTNRIKKDSNWKERFIITSKIEQEAARIPDKMDRKFDNLMKVLDEITYKRKYLEKEEVQGSSKRATTSVECPPKENNHELASRHQVSKWSKFCEGKRARTLVKYPKNKNLELAFTHQVSDAVLWEGKDPNLDWMSIG